MRLKIPLKWRSFRAVWVKTDQESSKSWSVGGWTNPLEKYESKWKSSPSRCEHKNYLRPPPSDVRWWHDLTLPDFHAKNLPKMLKKNHWNRISSLKKLQNVGDRCIYPNRSIEHMSNHISYTFVYLHIHCMYINIYVILKQFRCIHTATVYIIFSQRRLFTKAAPAERGQAITFGLPWSNLRAISGHFGQVTRAPNLAPPWVVSWGGLSPLPRFL